MFDADVLDAFAAHCAVVLGVEVEAVGKALVEAVGAAVGFGHGGVAGSGVWVERWPNVNDRGRRLRWRSCCAIWRCQYGRWFWSTVVTRSSLLSLQSLVLIYNNSIRILRVSMLEAFFEILIIVRIAIVAESLTPV